MQKSVVDSGAEAHLQKAGEFFLLLLLMLLERKHEIRQLIGILHQMGVLPVVNPVAADLGIGVVLDKFHHLAMVFLGQLKTVIKVFGVHALSPDSSNSISLDSPLGDCFKKMLCS